RDIQPGDVFVACEGIHSHGIDFLDQAIAQGAKAVLIEARDDFIIDSSIPVLKVPDLKNVLGHLADQWYGYPSKTLNIIAITGTNGKTSCVNWVAQALNHGGQPCATIGTLGAIMPDGTQLGGYLT